jgi:hypothetical protein
MRSVSPLYIFSLEFVRAHRGRSRRRPRREPARARPRRRRHRCALRGDRAWSSTSSARSSRSSSRRRSSARTVRSPTPTEASSRAGARTTRAPWNPPPVVIGRDEWDAVNGLAQALPQFWTVPAHVLARPQDFRAFLDGDAAELPPLFRARDLAPRARPARRRGLVPPRGRRANGPVRGRRGRRSA